MEKSMDCRMGALEAELEGSFNPGIAVSCWNLQEMRGSLKVFDSALPIRGHVSVCLGNALWNFIYITEKHFARRCEFQIVH